MSGRARGAAAAGLAAFVVAGCGSDLPTGLENEQRRLDRQRAVWATSGITSYQYRVERFCFCVPGARGPARVTVRGGAVVAVELVSTGEPPAPELLSSFPAVDSLFEIIQDAIDRRAEVLEVTYDPTFGFPARISVDYDLRLADEEMALQATELQPHR